MSAGRDPVERISDSPPSSEAPVAVDAADVLAALRDPLIYGPQSVSATEFLAALDAAGFDVLPRGQFRDPEGQVWQAMFRDTGMFWWKKVPVAGEGSTDGE